jgi:hypothetical protein
LPEDELCDFFPAFLATMFLESPFLTLSLLLLYKLPNSRPDGKKKVRTPEQ